MIQYLKLLGCWLILAGITAAGHRAWFMLEDYLLDIPKKKV